MRHSRTGSAPLTSSADLSTPWYPCRCFNTGAKSSDARGRLSDARAGYRFPGSDPVNLEGRAAKIAELIENFGLPWSSTAKIRPAAIGSAVQFCSRWSSGLS